MRPQFVQIFYMTLTVLGFMFLGVFTMRLMRYFERMQVDRMQPMLSLSETVETKTPNREQPAEGGYIILNLPEEQRSAFIDLLKGFEEFAQAKGYSVLFSVNSQSATQIAFKFTIADSGISVSTEKVKHDFEDYIDRIRTGKSLDDLPIVVSPEQHEILIMTMKNRIKFLEYNHNLKQNAEEFYERLLAKVESSVFGFHQTPSVYVQTGGSNDARQITAIGSPQAIQGDHSGGNVQTIDQSVRVSHSFNERKSQIEELQKLIELLKVDPTDSEDIRDQAILNLEMAQDELSEEEVPDTGRLHRWFNKAKDLIAKVQLSQEALGVAKKVFTMFGIDFPI